MSKYSTIGGIRMRHSGRVTKNSLLNELKIALDSLVNDFQLESFSGANLYLQMYNKDGDRLALISSNGHVANGLDVNDLREDFSFNKIGCTVLPVKDVERDLEALSIEQEKRDAADREEYLAYQQKEKAEKEELKRFRKVICTEFGVGQINEVASSVGRITTTKGMSKYIKESQIPDCGYVYRASLKDRNTGKISEIRIYDDNFLLIYSSLTK